MFGDEPTSLKSNFMNLLSRDIFDQIINLITIFSNQLKDYVQKSRMTDALEKTFLCYKGNGEYQKLPQ